MKQKSLLGFSVGLVMLLVAILGGVQWQARKTFILRGRETGFPEPVDDTGLPQACINVALEQYAPSELAWALGMVEDGGFAWVRQRFPWADIEPARATYQWGTWDAMVKAAVDRNLRIIPVLDTAPGWAGMPPQPEDFARFAAVFAERYAEVFSYYQIWHNPNLGDAWGGAADPYQYTALLAQASEAIRAADPDARIILGSLAPTIETGDRNYAEDLFLEMLYVAGAARHFDVVAAQPYGFFTGPEDRRAQRDILNFSRPLLIRETLVAHQDSQKAIWVSHFGWNSKPAEWPGPPTIWGDVSQDTQITYTLAALERAEDEWPWMGVMCLNGFQPRPELMARDVPNAEEHWGFALVGPDGVPRPLYAALQTQLSHDRLASPGVYHAATELATFEGDWTWGIQGADIGKSGDRVSLDFEGTGIALTVRRGPYRAFLFVTVDGVPAPALPRDTEGNAYVVLYDPLAAIATVPLAENLPYGKHTVEVVAERGWGQWALVDWRVANQPELTRMRLGTASFVMLGVIGFTLCVVFGRGLDWGAVGRLMKAIRTRVVEWLRMLVSVALSAVYLFAAWQTIGNGAFRRLGEGTGLTALALATGMFYFSPWLLLTLASGALLALIVFFEPALGLALTIFAAPLYLHPLSLLGKSFSLAELLLLPTLVGWVVWLVNTHMRRGRAFLRIKDINLKRLGFNALARQFLLPVGLFVLVSVLSTLFAEHTREALRELRLVIIEPVFFFLMLVSLPLKARERWRIVDGWVLSAVLVAVIGLVQYFLLGDVITAEGGIRRLRSLYGSPNNVGLYLGRVLPILIAVVLWGGRPTSRTSSQNVPTASNIRIQGVRLMRQNPRRLAYALALFPVGMALLLSMSRGAIILGIPSALLVLGLLAGRRWRRVTLVLLVLGALALIPLFRTPRFAALLDPSSGSAGFRLSLWRSAGAMFCDRPLLGVGPDNFLYAYRTRYVLPTAWEEFNLSHPHNVVMDFASRVGVLGLIALLGMQFIFWRGALRLRYKTVPATRALALGMMGSMADFLGHGLVDASYFVVDLAFVFFLSLAVVVWYADD